MLERKFDLIVFGFLELKGKRLSTVGLLVKVLFVPKENSVFNINFCPDQNKLRQEAQSYFSKGSTAKL